MDTMYGGGGDPTGKKNKKNKKGLKIDGCWSGGQGKSCDTRVPRVKPKHKTSQPETPAPASSDAGTHMNVRDLGNDPGDVKPQLRNSNSSYTTSQASAAAAAERGTTKARKKLKIIR